MHILVLIIVGAAAGLVATRLMRVEANPLTILAIGILGALGGGLLLAAVLTVMSWLATFIAALLGAMVLLWLWNRYGPD